MEGETRPKRAGVAEPAGQTVLFVDDEPALLDSLKRAMRKEDYAVITAVGAADGLEILAKHRVDVVVSDEQMPKMSGSEFLARVRQEYPDTIRIILTGQASLDSAIRAINEGGVFRFLVKPCNHSDLTHTIRQALLLKKLTQESSRLVVAARDQRTAIEELESKYPGISKIERSETGCVVLEEASESVEEVIRQIRKATGAD